MSQVQLRLSKEKLELARLRPYLFGLLVNFGRLAFGTSKSWMSPKVKSQKHVATCFSASGF
uniref:Uncharacterized protein n=1 Tax=Arundo donax TaxID=35708 RepID=A0A0A9GRP7_ARUDO